MNASLVLAGKVSHSNGGSKVLAGATQCAEDTLKVLHKMCCDRGPVFPGRVPDCLPVAKKLGIKQENVIIAGLYELHDRGLVRYLGGDRFVPFGEKILSYDI